ncbi:MAG: ring-cleaving dioxygenase [Anaerolineales bacterium]|jgi:glyoxalase family protein
MQLTGIHHVTAVTARIAENLDFYTRVLGLRLVKKSVNQDDVSAYHLFYADKLGSPGTDITFFDWPNIGPNVRGTDSIAGTAFRVGSQDALAFWRGRLDEYGIKRGDITGFAGRQILPFEDFEGQRLYFVNDLGAEFEGEIWPRPDIPDEYALRGFNSVILSLPSIHRLAGVFEDFLNFEERVNAKWIDEKSNAFIYTTRKNGGPASEVWLLEQPHERRSRLGAGGTHHVAFRVSDAETQEKWHVHLSNAGFQVSGLIDRFWFQSIYFRVTNGILFEIATDGPGFAIDEAPHTLGEKLVLPPFLEKHRLEIESRLAPIGVESR